MNQSSTFMSAAGFSTRSLAVPHELGGGDDHIVPELPVGRRGNLVLVGMRHRDQRQSVSIAHEYAPFLASLPSSFPKTHDTYGGVNLPGNTLRPLSP
jgi:hypothetical protein